MHFDCLRNAATVVLEDVYIERIQRDWMVVEPRGDVFFIGQALIRADDDEVECDPSDLYELHDIREVVNDSHQRDTSLTQSAVI